MDQSLSTHKIHDNVISAFKQEFSFLQDKFEIMDLLANGSPMDWDTINTIRLPTHDNNIVWHPGVYVFIGNNCIYRVGVSMTNSRARVMEHLRDWTAKNGHCIWDIDKHDDKSILLFNIKNTADRHWLLSLETYLEIKFEPLIKAGRIG